MRKYAKHPEKYPIEERFARLQKLDRYVLKKLHVVYDIDGLDEYYKTKKEGHNRLIVCNHLSDADPMVLVALAKTPLSFVAKKETENFPFIGKVVKALSGEFLDRNDLKQELRVMMRLQDKMTKYKNLDFVIFPEGTRNKNPLEDVLEFKHGSFRPAMKSGSDFSVVSIYGSQRVFNIKCKNNNNPIEVRYLKTFTYDDYKDFTTSQMAKISYDMVNNEIKKLRLVDKELMYKLNKKHQDD